MNFELKSLSLKIIIFFLFFFLYVQYFSMGSSTNPQEPQLFNLSDLSGALNFLYQVTNEQETSEDQLSRDINRQFMEGGIQFNAKGSIYHPNLLSFGADINIIGHRSKNVYFSDASVNNAINNTYNIQFWLFSKKKLNFNFYAVRSFSTADRIFSGRFFTTLKTIGVQVRSRHKFLPFELDMYNIQLNSESLTYKERNEKSSNIELRTNVLNKPRTRSMVTMKHKNYFERVYDIEYRSFELMSTFNHYYGIKDRNILTSILTYNRLQGDYNYNILFFRNNAIHYLKPKLYLDASYLLTKDKSFEHSLTKHEISTSLNHQLYESLNSAIYLGSRFENSTHQGVTAWIGRIHFNYQKKIPTGNIQVFYSLHRENSNYKSLESLISDSEKLDFTLTDTIIITRPGINVDSIQITNPDFSAIYLNGVDYLIQVINNTITITRLPGGEISSGATIIVHFQYLSYPDFKLKSYFSQINLRLNFLKYFHLIYMKHTSNHHINSLYMIPPFENYNRISKGVQLTSKILNIDYITEDYNSNLSAYTANNFRVAAHFNLIKKFQLTANLSKNQINFKDQSFFNHFDTYSIESSIQLKNNIFANAIYRKIDYATPGYSRSRESIVGKLHWKFRKIVIDLFYEHILTHTDIYEKGHHFFSLILRRMF